VAAQAFFSDVHDGSARKPVFLGILDALDIAAVPQGSADYVHLCVEATKQAFLLRDKHMGDAAFDAFDWQALLDDAAALDGLAAEERYRIEPADGLTPESLYERRWALALLDRVFARLQSEWEAAGKAAMFAGLRSFLSGEDERGFAEAGAAVGLSEGAARVTVHRLRQQYRTLLREEILQTLDDPARVEEEIRHLMSALRG
jgi:hypothetical protein